MVTLIGCKSNARVRKDELLSKQICWWVQPVTNKYLANWIISPKKGAKHTPPRLEADIQNEIRNFFGPEAFQDSSWAHWHTFVFDAFVWHFCPGPLHHTKHLSFRSDQELLNKAPKMRNFPFQTRRAVFENLWNSSPTHRRKQNLWHCLVGGFNPSEQY